MLISIDRSVVDKGDENTWDDDTVLALENLATARREGKHLVIAERETLKKIAQCSRLSQYAKSLYHTLYNKSTQQFQSSRSAVTRYIEIVNPCYSPQIVSASGQQIIKVAPNFFNDSESVQKTILLCENSDDAVLYETIAKVYLIWKRTNVQIVCEPRGGGGNTISSEYVNIQTLKKRLCLCIVDSDKIAPEGKLGSTASRLQSLSNSNCINTQTLILDCREIENLIPNSILSELCAGNKERLEALKIFENISSSAIEIRNFLDVKKGTKMKEIIQESNPKIKDFWEVKIPLIPHVSSCIDAWCKDNWQCSSKSGECQCKISLAFGESTLSNTVEYLKQKSPHEIARIVDESMSDDWNKIGQIVVNWCIADRPIRV
jgi:hypothetical protein